MAIFKFTAKSGTHVTACETSDESKAWKWIAQTKRLAINKVKDLYNITKIK